MSKTPADPATKKKGSQIRRLRATKETFPAIFAKHRAIITSACKAAGIDRDTYYRWLKEDPIFAKACDDASNIAGDFVESKLYDLIEQGNATTIIFYCKTKLRERGYVEKSETTVTHLMHEQAIKELAGDDLAELEDKSQ